MSRAENEKPKIHVPLAAQMERERKEREKAEAEAKSKIELSDPYLWRGKLELIPAIVQSLRYAGLKDVQIKFVEQTGALRISDYMRRATAQPGEVFWLLGEDIWAGTKEEYEEQKQLWLASQAAAE